MPSKIWGGEDPPPPTTRRVSRIPVQPWTQGQVHNLAKVRPVADRRFVNCRVEKSRPKFGRKCDVGHVWNFWSKKMAKVITQSARVNLLFGGSGPH